MRRLLLLALFVLSGVAAESSYDVRFSTPAHVRGTVEFQANVTGVQFAVAGATMEAQEATVYHVRSAHAEAGEDLDSILVPGETPSVQAWQGHDVRIVLGEATQAGFFFQGDCERIVLEDAQLLGYAANRLLSENHADAAYDDPWIRFMADWQAGLTWAFQTAFLTSGCDSLRLELYNVTGRVVNGDGGYELANGPFGIAHDEQVEASVSHYDILDLRGVRFNEVMLQEGYVAGPGAISVEGEAMLPAAVGTLTTAGGELSFNGTWVFQGNLTMDRFSQNGGTIRAQANIHSGALLVNSQQVWSTTSATAAATTVGSVVIVGALVKYLYATALFTRLSPREALEHPRRQALVDYIHEHPGATFRELCRATEIPAGTCRHHLSVLDRAQVIVEHRHRSTVRFFENHGKFDNTWQEVVMLRDPELERLHGWITEHQGSIQKDILDQAGDWGWSRSTTQHRLQRLVDNGLVVVQEMGRRKLYSIAQSTTA